MDNPWTDRKKQNGDTDRRRLPRVHHKIKKDLRIYDGMIANEGKTMKKIIFHLRFDVYYASGRMTLGVMDHVSRSSAEILRV
jgi:hypothetical protein